MKYIISATVLIVLLKNPGLKIPIGYENYSEMYVCGHFLGHPVDDLPSNDEHL